MSNKKRILLIGNPNSGKSTLFNTLTGLHQKIGNHAGITVDKKVGSLQIEGEVYEIIDLPGIYSLYPKSMDEEVVLKEMFNQEYSNDLILYVLDSNHIDRSLMAFTQLQDLDLPLLLVINETTANKDLIGYRKEIASKLHQEVVVINAKKSKAVEQLRAKIPALIHNPWKPTKNLFSTLQKKYPAYSQYETYRDFIVMSKFDTAGTDNKDNESDIAAIRTNDTIHRFNYIESLSLYGQKKFRSHDLSDKIDRWVIHPATGMIILLGILFIVFQAVYAWSGIPMDLLDGFFGQLQNTARDYIPEGWLADLVSEGIIPGIGGILIFVPQIAFLFLFLTILEEIGYMARIAFVLDKLMRVFGLGGQSLVPLISGYACAIPAVMAARSIKGFKERMITIFVVPLMTCSARLPVYAILISMVIPSVTIWGIFNLQGIVLMGLYLLGFVASLVLALIVSKVYRIEEHSTLIIELPQYRLPSAKNVLLTIFNQIKAFVYGAGKIILIISIILWFLSTYGIHNDVATAEAFVDQNHATATSAEKDRLISSFQLENSFAGNIGKIIEPAIEPLGYDWKIGIALITSFAAREVFVGSLSTIYNVGEQDQATIRQRLMREVNSKTGKPRFDLATGLSLLLFFAFAMQCMSTLAIVKQETNSWKWPILQFVIMTAIAYVFAFLVYSIFQ